MPRIPDEFEFAKIFGRAFFMLVFLVPAGIALAVLIVSFI